MELDLLILGAGMAGLQAANLLSQSGLRIAIVEARDRLGGRIHTIMDPILSAPLDLGAEFIHGRPAQTERLLRQAKVLAYDVPDRHYFLRGRRLTENNTFWRQIEQVMSRLPDPGAPDCSFDRFLQKQRGLSGPTRRRARDFIRGFDAADTSRIGVAGLAIGEEMSEKIGGEKALRPLGGYHALIAHLAERIKERGIAIHLNTVVRHIKWSRGGCRVTADGNGKLVAFTTKKILVTIPVGVLKTSDLVFSPLVPGLAESLAALEMGPVVKIMIRFRDAFWERRDLGDLSFMHSPASPFPTWWTQLPLRVPVMAGWAGGPRAAVLAGKSDKQILDAGVATLAKCFATSRSWIVRQIDSHWIGNWPADPFARGAYSYININGLPAAQRFHTLGQNILFFAGEHTHPALAGTVAAALASAERIVPRILRAAWSSEVRIRGNGREEICADFRDDYVAAIDGRFSNMDRD